MKRVLVTSFASLLGVSAAQAVDYSFGSIIENFTLTPTDHARALPGGTAAGISFNDNGWGGVYDRGAERDATYMHFDLSSLAGFTINGSVNLNLTIDAQYGGTINGGVVGSATNAWSFPGTTGGITAISGAGLSGSYSTGQIATSVIDNTTFQGFVTNPSTFYGLGITAGAGSTAHFSGATLTGSAIADLIKVTGGTDWSAATWNGGTSTLSIAGTSDVSGGNVTVRSGGIIAVTDSATLGTGSFAGNFASAGILAFGSSANQTLSGEISGIGSLIKTGDGTLTLSGSNSYTGGTTISGGTVVASRSRLGTGAVVVNNGGKLYVDDQWVLCGVNPYNVTERNIGTLTINAGGTLHLDPTNGFANGATNLYLNGGSVIGGASDDARGALYLYNGNQQITAGGATTSSIASRLAVTGNNNNITVDAGSTLDISGGIKDADWYGNGSTPGGFFKLGTGTLVLSGPSTYSGQTNITGGTLLATNSTALGPGGHNGATMSLIQDGATLALQGGISLDEHFHVWGSGVGGLGAVRSLSGNNALTNAPSGGAGYAIRSNLTVGVDADSLTVSGFYEEAGNFSLTKIGTGNLTLTAPSSYTAGTIVSSGTLLLNGGSGGVARVRGPLTVESGAVVNFANDDGTGLGWNGSAKVTALTINGGTVSSSGVMHVWDLPGGVTMTGGTLQSNNGVSNANGPQLEWNNADVTTNASATTATIGGRIRLRPDNGATGITFTTADGAAATDLRVTAAITETGPQSITKQGAGSLFLNGANAYTGGTTLQEGTLNIGHDTAAGTGQVTVNGGMVAFDNAGLYEGLVNSNNSFDTSSPVPSGTIVWDTAKAHTTDSGVFANNHTWGYKGTIIVPDGAPVTWTFGKQFDDSVKLDINLESGVINNNSWNTPVSATRTLQPGRNDIEVRFGQGGGGVGPNSGWTIGFGVDTQGRGTTNPADFLPLGNSFFTSMLQHDNTVANSFALNATTEFQTSYNYSVNKLTGVLSGIGGVTKTGVGILTLANSMTYEGTTTVNGGTLRVETGGSFGSLAGAGPIVINNGGTVEVRVVDGLGYHNNVGTNSITVNEGGTLTVAAGARNSTDRNLNIVGGTVTSAQGVTFDSGASYYLRDTFSGGSNAYTFTSGPSGTPATLSAKDVSLIGAATFSVTDGPGAIDLLASSNLINTLGSGSLIKTGAGVMSLTANNTYTGGTTISEGTLITGAGGVSTGAVTVASGATLSTTSASSTGLAALYYNNSVNQANIASIPAILSHFGGNSPAPSLVQTTANMNFAANGSGFPAPYNSGGADFEAFYSGKVNITTAGTYTFNTSSDDGSMLFINGQAVVTNNFFQAVTTRSGTITLSPGMHDIVIAFNQGVGGYGMNAQMSGPDNTNMVDINTSNASITPDLVLGSLAGAGNVVLSTGNLITGIDNSSTSFTGSISNIGSVTKFGTGTQILAGANTYAGKTTISAGILQLGDGGTTGSLSTSSAIINNSNFTINRSNAVAQGTDFSGSAITGSGTLTHAGSGTTTLTADNTYSGATTVSGGTLILRGNYASPAFVISSGAVLELSRSTEIDYQNTDVTFSGSGTLRKTGAGRALWGPRNATFQLDAGSMIDVQGGTLVGGSHGNDVWTNNFSDLNVASGATFSGVEANVRVNALSGSGSILSGYSGAGYQSFTFGVGNGSGTFAGVLGNDASAGSFTKIGSGTQILTGASSYTGTTLISQGSLQLGDGGTGGSLSPNSPIQLDATLIIDQSDSVFQGSDLGTITSGSGGLVKRGSGSLTMNAANTFAGPINVQQGTLLLGASNTLPNSASLSLSAGTTLGTGGFSDNVGPLTLAGSSILNFSAGGGSILTFSDITSWSGVLKIYNYTGVPWVSGSDQLIFSANTATPDFLTGVEFYSDAGNTLIGAGGAFLNGGTTGELVPVPEPQTCLAALALVVTVAWRERRRLGHNREA